MYKEILKNIEPREYQAAIYKTCVDNNTLIAVPTGLGKTVILLMIAINRMQSFPRSKVLFLAPTKPLAFQQLEYFKKNLPENFAKMELFTGKIKSEKRKELWQIADIIFSTPQTIKNDLEKNMYDLKDVCLLIEDEAHHCLKNYAYNFVSQKYKEQAINQRIIGATASVGVKKDIIQEVMNNLNIQKIEIRTRDSEDVKAYVQELSFKKITVDLPYNFYEIKNLFNNIINSKVTQIRSMGLLLGPTTKRVVLEEIKKISAMIKKDPNSGHLYQAMSICGMIIRCNHAIELLETQSLHTLNDFIQETYKGTTKGMQNLIKIPEFIKINELVTNLLANNIENPKMDKIKELILEQQKINSNFKTLIFSNYRTTTGAIAAMLNRNGIAAGQLVGQKKTKTSFGEAGSSQIEQQQIVKDFKSSKIIALASTSIGEEGLDLPEVHAVIFYEPVPSAIRSIQRRGRVGRMIKGSLFLLVARNSLDEIYYYSSVKKEEKMNKSMEELGNSLNNNTISLDKYIPAEEDPSKWQKV